MGRHEVLFDMPKALGGEGRAAGPLAMFAVSSAACFYYWASGVLQEKELPIEGLEVEVFANKVSEPEMRLDQLRFTVRLPKSVPAELHAEVEATVRGCPVHGTLTHPPVIEVIVE